MRLLVDHKLFERRDAESTAEAEEAYRFFYDKIERAVESYNKDNHDAWVLTVK